MLFFVVIIMNNKQMGDNFEGKNNTNVQVSIHHELCFFSSAKTHQVSGAPFFQKILFGV